MSKYSDLYHRNEIHEEKLAQGCLEPVKWFAF